MSSTLQSHGGVNTNKLEKEIQSGANLSHVLAPKEGLRDESHALSGLKGQVIQEAAHHGMKGLHHVDHIEGEGITDNIKQAYLQEHQGAKKGCQCPQGQCKC